MSMQYIRDTYNVPVKRGMLVCWQGHLARITSASNHVRIRFVDPNGVWGARTLYVHPTDDIAYLLPTGQWLYTDVSDKTLAACKEYSEQREKEEKKISRKEDIKKGDTVKPDFSKAKEGDECWLYGIGKTVINSIGDDYVTVWDDENKYIFDKSGYLYFIGEYIGDAFTQGVFCELEEFPMLFNSFAQFQAYWLETD